MDRNAAESRIDELLQREPAATLEALETVIDVDRRLAELRRTIAAEQNREETGASPSHS